MTRRRRLPVLLLLAALGATGCGTSEKAARPGGSATLLLDFQPNAVHAGLYSAVARGYDEAEGVKLHIRVPGTSTDAVKLLLSGRTTFAILDIHDLALAREKGRDIVGVMPIVQRPLAAVLAQPDVRSPRDLEGRRVGVTGLPSDDAVLDSIVTGAGGDPKKVSRTTIGFNAVPSLLADKVAGATAFWSVEGVNLARRRPGFHSFKVDAYGAPTYPELVLVVARTTLTDDPATVRATVDAIRRGEQFAIDDPESSTQDLLAANPGLDAGEIAAQLDALDGAFVGDDDKPGVFDPRDLIGWAGWEQRFGIVRTKPAVRRMFDLDAG